MFKVKNTIVLVLMLALCSPVLAVEMKMAYQPGQEQTMDTAVKFQGSVVVDGSMKMEGKTQGEVGVIMNSVTEQVDEEGFAVVSYQLDGLTVQADSQAKIDEETFDHSVKMDETGGTMILNGETQEIPGMGLEEVRSQSWKARLDPQGSPVSFDFDDESVSEEQKAAMQEISSSVAKFTGNSQFLPSGDVEPGHTWKTELKVKELTEELARENPMISAFTDLGIPDFVTESTFKDVREEDKSQIAGIESKTNWVWQDGQIPLGIVNITVKNLSIQGDHLTDFNLDQGYIPRITTVMNITFDLGIELPIMMGPDGTPETYQATGQIRMESSSLTQIK